MKTLFRPARLPAELRSLVLFDHKAFHQFPGDWFPADMWAHYQCWWLILDNQKIGCCAFEHNVDFKQDLRTDDVNPKRHRSLYIASTGILPRFQGHGFGSLMKSWQLAYARYHGFKRIITNTRKSNLPIIALNKQFGFQTIRTTPGYYVNPSEPTVVMERRLP